MLISSQTDVEKRGISSQKRRSGSRTLIFRTFGAVLIAGSICASSARSDDSPHRIQITAKRYSFQPAEITVKKGETVDLALTSSDVTHGVRIRELNVDLRAGKGKTADVDFTPEKSGTFVGHCSVFCGSGHGQMTLTIHVVG